MDPNAPLSPLKVGGINQENPFHYLCDTLCMSMKFSRQEYWSG